MIDLEKFEEMCNRAIHIADLKAKAWCLPESYLYIEVSSKWITAMGNDEYGDSCQMEFPTSYMNLTDDEIHLKETVLYQASLEAKAERKAAMEAKEKEHRRGLYLSLNKEFRNELAPKDE